MKNILLILIFSFLPLEGQIKLKSNFSVKNTPLRIKELGKVTNSIYYKVKFRADSKSTSKKETVCLLQIGNNMSKFFDYHQLRYDSIVQKYNDKKYLGAQEVEELLKVKVIWSNVIVKKYDSLTVQDRFKNLYEYNEIKPDFNWKLEEGSKKVLNYDCKKATLAYAGRVYTAWYAKEIPIYNGPYKFEGLPGLILEMYDSQEDFHFEAVGINNKSLPIYIRSDEKIFRVSKEKFRTIEMSYYENPGFFHGKAFDADGKELYRNSNKLPYNLIELR